MLARQCLNRRIGDRETLAREVRAWGAARNAAQITIDWQFMAMDARSKLNRLYPVIKEQNSAQLCANSRPVWSRCLIAEWLAYYCNKEQRICTIHASAGERRKKRYGLLDAEMRSGYHGLTPTSH
jgi:hypothetical protein